MKKNKSITKNSEMEWLMPYEIILYEKGSHAVKLSLKNLNTCRALMGRALTALEHVQQETDELSDDALDLIDELDTALEFFQEK